MLECEHRKDLHWILTPGGFQQSFRVWERCPGCLGHRMGIVESTRDACFYQSSFTIIYTMQLRFTRKKVLHLKFFKQPTYFNFSVWETMAAAAGLRLCEPVCLWLISALSLWATPGALSLSPSLFWLAAHLRWESIVKFYLLSARAKGVSSGPITSGK